MKNLRAPVASLVAASLLFLAWQAAPASSQAQDESTATTVLRHNNLGIAWMDQLKFEEAAGEFSKVVEADPEFVPGWVNRGLAYFYLQDYDKALFDLKQALRLDPEQTQAHFAMGILQRNQNQQDEAVESFLKVHAQDPDDPATNYFLGSLYRLRREYDECIPYYRKAIQLEPYNKSAYYGLSQALMRSGKREQAVELLNEFRRLEGLSGTDTVGQSYREQGRYAVAIDRIPEKYLPGRQDDPSAGRIAVRFREAAQDSGLASFKHGGPGKAVLTAGNAESAASRIAPALGSGVALGDYDGDGDLDAYLANASAGGARGGLFRNQGSGTFTEVDPAQGLDVRDRTLSALWGDIDNDGDLDLYLINAGPNRMLRNDGGRFADITQETGLGDSAWGLGGTFVDSDHDGDLDLLVANFIAPAGGGTLPEDFPGADNRHYRNNGDGTFSDVSEASKLAGGGKRTLGVLASDFDNSRDIDFYLVNHGAPNQLFSNLRDGTFRDVAGEKGLDLGGRQAWALSAGDLNRDAWMDFALAGLQGQSLLNAEGKRFEALDLPETPATAYASHLLDYDNDGDLDLLVLAAPLIEDSGPSGIRLYRNNSGRFSDVTADAGLDAYDGRPLRGGAVGDVDSDGDLDILISVNGDSPLLLLNEGGNANNWITVETRGTNSNKAGIGTKVEIRSGDFHLKSEVYGGSGALSQSSSRVHFGLGKRTRADFLRLRWPGGVLQAELNPPVSQLYQIEELDRKGTSCPILYVWNGESYEFVTDFLGGSAYGYLLAPGQYNYPDTDEYLLLPRDRLRLQDGLLKVSLNNQLEEVIFFDKLQLLAVDHPTGYSVVPDEKLLPGPPYDPFGLHTLSDPRPPVAAHDGQGRDVLAAISQIDRVYPQLFEELPFKGYATDHQLILDLGAVSAERTVLVMQAWIDYADSTSNLAASQAGVQLKPPVLQVRDEQGGWKTVIERMGFPAGLPKSMTVDLSGKFLSDSRQVRILTNMRIHWDQILVESGPARQDYRLTRLEPHSAQLDFYGFPEFSSPDGRQPKIYFYDRVSPLGGWKVHAGAYTRFGDVNPLLREVDDMYVITRSGDRIQAAFDVSGLPELSDGWARDYVLFVDGFGKDMDLNSAGPDFVAPLPFHSMSAFPYPSGEHYPDTPRHRDYRRNYNTRIEPSTEPDY
ncbi:MAG TPA: FG-GAP-like repeat-containing protein [Acidobacteriota bacterium]|nr:FG-GAP-like repeat-containing protein [Acidobacteriota bacterium]